MAAHRQRTADISSESRSFQDLLLPADLIRGLGKLGFHRPTPRAACGCACSAPRGGCPGPGAHAGCMCLLAWGMQSFCRYYRAQQILCNTSSAVCQNVMYHAMGLSQ